MVNREELKNKIEQKLKACYEAQQSGKDSSIPLSAIGRLWNQHKRELTQHDFARKLIDIALIISQQHEFSPETVLSCTSAALETIAADIPEEFTYELYRLEARLKPEDADAVFDWLRLCYDVTDKRYAHYIVLYARNRDDEMRQIVFDEQGQVRDYFRKYSAGPIYLRKIADWFLQRYDIDAASVVFRTLIVTEARANWFDKLCKLIEKLVTKLCTLITIKTKQQLLPKLARRDLGTAFVRRLGILAVYVIALLVLLFCTTVSSVRHEVFPFLAKWITIHLPFGSATLQSSKEAQIYWGVLPYQIGLILSSIFLGWWFLYRMKGRFYYTFRLILPRLLGGILLGYMPLVSGGELWKWLLSLTNQYIQIILFLSPLVLSFSYTYIEARNFLIEWEPTKHFRREIYIRATKVFLMGLSEAFMVGILLSELLGDIIISDLGLKTTLEPVVGFVGLIYPRIVLLYAPAALFVGLLVQLIWEEKSVTHPL